MGDAIDTVPSAEDSPDSASMMGDWSAAGDFFASILSGLLVGLAADYFLGTDPWLVIVGVIAGFVVGFWRMIAYSNRIMEQADNPRLQRIARMRRELEEDEDDA